MSAGTEQRKLAVILFADMSAYFTNSPTKRTLRWHD